MTIDLPVDDTKRESDPDALLVVDNLSVSFPTDDGIVNAVRGISYTVQSGEAMGIVGESGSGKSVTALAIMGLLPRTAWTAGSVRLHGEEILGASDADLSAVRGEKIAM
ncbi:MAG: glutathione transport system ATP-binding protein, partial [Pseudonocardiales bacterium]|nr:glutathione transport system ATP-binding protein [Pseudonocardiales bacterium]